MTKCIRPEKTDWRGKTNEARDYCYRCIRPKRVCLCNSIVVENNKCAIGILQHPNEEGKTFNTAKIAQLSLTNSFLYTGVSFDDHKDFNTTLSGYDTSKTGVLYPSSKAIDLSEAPNDLECLIIVDGTWPEAKQILKKTTCFNQIQHYAFKPETISNYSLRKEPDVDYVCSLEAIVESLRIIEQDRTVYQSLLYTLDDMIKMQEDLKRTKSNSRHKSSSDYMMIKKRIKELNRMLYSSNIQNTDVQPLLKELESLKEKIQ